MPGPESKSLTPADPSQETPAVKQPQITFSDINLMVGVITAATKGGALNPADLKTVGGLYEKLSEILKRPT